MNAYNITIVGGAGIVGREFLKILDEQNIPVARLRLLATARSAGKQLEFRGKQITIEETSEQSFSAEDHIVFLSASGSASKLYAPIAQRNGSFVLDDSSAYRMDPEVPLVIPEINPEDLEWHHGIVSQPNCTTTPMAMALFPDGVQAFDLRAALHRLNLPCQILWGRRDHIMPPAHAIAAEGEFALHLLSGAGHIPQIECPDRVARITQRLISAVEVPG